MSLCLSFIFSIVAPKVLKKHACVILLLHKFHVPAAQEVVSFLFLIEPLLG